MYLNSIFNAYKYCPALIATYWRMEFSLNSFKIKFILVTELPTHRHSRRLNDIVETLTGDAATLSRLFWVFESDSGNGLKIRPEGQSAYNFQGG